MQNIRPQSIIVKDRQSVMDIALQHTGNVEAAFDLAVKNNVSLTADLETGSESETVEVINKEIVYLYDRDKTEPALRDSNAQLIPGGINYMQIGTDFKVR